MYIHVRLSLINVLCWHYFVGGSNLKLSKFSEHTVNKIEAIQENLVMDTEVVLNKLQSPHILDHFIYNKLLPSQITDQLEGILRNITELNEFPEEVDKRVFMNNSISSVGDDIEEIKKRFVESYPIESWKKHGWFNDEFLHLINIHWLHFPPQPRVAHYTLGALYSAIALCGFLGNIMVIFMFVRCPSLRTPANILVVNLAISDFFMISKTPLFIYNSAYLGPATGEIGCKIYGFVGGITGTVSIGTLAAIAFDRYSVVVYPLEPLRSITRIRAKLSVLIVWIYGIFFAIIPALDIGLGRYVPEGFLTSCSFDYLTDDKQHKIFIFAFFCAAWLLPLLIISFCYINIFIVVIKTRSTLSRKQGSVSSRHCKEQEKRKSELKLAGVVIAVIALFFAAWTPYAVVALLGIFGYKHLIYPLVSMIPAICCKIASCIDPFIYIFSHPKFKLECQNLLKCKKPMRKRSTIRWSTHVQPVQQGPEITSEDDVEVIEMEKIPYSSVLSLNQEIGKNSPKKQFGQISTISHTHIKGKPMNFLPKTEEDNKQLQPPSWFVKPKFTKGDNSIKKVVKHIQRIKSDDSCNS